MNVLISDAVGRPPRTQYNAAERIQLNVDVPLEVKRALVGLAERNGRRLGAEVRHALASWTDPDATPRS